MATSNEQPPYEGGSQPVEEHPTGTTGEGRGAMQVVVIVIAVLVVLAALFWLVVPMLSAD